MEQNPKIEQGSERKGLTGPPHDDQTDDSGSRFEYPSQTILRTDARPNENGKENGEPG